MDDKKKRPPFDLSNALRPLKAEVNGLGEVELDVRTVGFLEWLEAGDKKRLWDDPSTFVRDLLRERGRLGGEQGEKPDAERVASLDNAALEQVAERIIAASGRLFAPRQTIDENTGKLCPYREGDPDPLDPLADEAPSARLLRVARNYLAYHQAMSRRLVEELKSARGIVGLAERADPLAPLRRTQKLFDEISGASLQRRLGLIQGSAALKALELATKPPLLDHHRLLVEQLGLANSPLARVRDSLDGMLGLKALGDRTRMFADIAAWSRSLDRHFGFDIARGILERPDGGIAERALAEMGALLRPGFQSVAMLGLEGLAAQGAAADILRLYDEIPDEEAEAFAAVVAGVTVIDADEEDPEEMATALERAWFVISRALGFVKDEVQKAGLIAMLALIVAVHSDWVAMNPARDIQLERKVEALTGEIQGLRSDFDAQRDTTLRSPIRYVHRTARLRAEPHREAQIIRLIYADQLLRIIDRRGDWVMVEAFDYPTDAPVRGWIHRGNLRREPLS